MAESILKERQIAKSLVDMRMNADQSAYRKQFAYLPKWRFPRAAQAAFHAEWHPRKIYRRKRQWQAHSRRAQRGHATRNAAIRRSRQAWPAGETKSKIAAGEIYRSRRKISGRTR
jgi:hypothetical protein